MSTDDSLAIELFAHSVISAFWSGVLTFAFHAWQNDWVFWTIFSVLFFITTFVAFLKVL